MKTTSIVKRKEKLVRKIKKFGACIEAASVVAEEEEEEDGSKEEEEKGKGPMELTKGLGEDKEEGAKEEEAKKACTQTEQKTRKATTNLVAQPKAKKAIKPTQSKPKNPRTRATTRAITQSSRKKKKRERRPLNRLVKCREREENM